MENVVDARGLSCPQPIIVLKKELSKKKFPVKILVDNVTSCENMQRFAEKNNYTVSIEKVNDDFQLILDT